LLSCGCHHHGGCHWVVPAQTIWWVKKKRKKEILWLTIDWTLTACIGAPNCITAHPMAQIEVGAWKQNMLAWKNKYWTYHGTKGGQAEEQEGQENNKKQKQTWLHNTSDNEKTKRWKYKLFWFSFLKQEYKLISEKNNSFILYLNVITIHLFSWQTDDTLKEVTSVDFMWLRGWKVLTYISSENLCHSHSHMNYYIPNLYVHVGLNSWHPQNELHTKILHNY